jgi:DNA mismatch repair protein MLH1
VLCHRHTTSKLASFEDLETINTLGFRGEALCSISFVSNLSVTTMTEGAIHGYRVAYKVCVMVDGCWARIQGFGKKGESSAAVIGSSLVF